MSYVVKRDSKGNRTVTYFGKSKDGKPNKITSKKISKDSYKKKYRSGSSGSQDLAYDTAISINKQQSTQTNERQAANTRPTLIDEKTGRTLTPVESYGAAGMSTEQGTRYVIAKTPTRTPTTSSVSEEWKNVPRASPAPSPAPAPQAVIGPARKDTLRTRLSQRAANVKTNFRGRVQPRIESSKDKAYEVYNYYAPVVPAALTVAPSGVALAKGGASVYKTAAFPIVSRTTLAASKIASPAGRALAGTGAQLAGGVLLTKGVSTTGKIITRNPVTATNQGYEAYQAGLAASNVGRGRVDKGISKAPVIGRTIPLNKPRFEEGVRGYAKQKGLDEGTTIKAAYQSRDIRDVSVAAGFTYANTLSEIQGQVAISKVPAAKKGKFITGFKNIAVAGFGEGAGVIASEEASTGKRIKDFDYPKIAAGAVTGGITAGTLGGVIYSAKPAVSKGLLSAAYVTDPFEVVGDYTAGGIGVPTTTFTTTRSLTSTRTDAMNTRGRGRNQVIKGSVPPSLSNTVFSPSSPRATNNVRVVTPTQTFTNARSLTNPFSPVRPTTRNTVFSPVTPNTNTPTFINVRLNTNTPTNTRTTPTTPTSTFTRTNTFVPTFTGNRGFPLAPISLGGGFGGGFGRSFDRLRQPRYYQPSLTASVLGIRGSRPSKSLLKTGLVVRPL